MPSGVYKKTEKTKAKLRLLRLGKKCSPETKKRMSLAQKFIGNRPPIMFGKTNPSWKGGVWANNDKCRDSGVIRKWKKLCLKRDDFTCQKTGISGGELCVHHINNFAEFAELRCNVENGITLSRKAHEDFHKIYGKRNNTQKQILEFIQV